MSYDDGQLDNFSEVYLYTAGSWSRGQNIPYSCSDGTDVVLLNGVLHWLGETVHWTGDTATREETIISFDINSEKFMDLPFPEGTMTCPEQRLDVQVLGDSLCLVSSVRKVRVDVWVTQSYGVRESWTKEFTITQEIITANPSSLKFYGFAKNCEILIQLDDCFGLYDRKNNSLRILNLNGTIDGYLFSESYVESLVSVTSTMEQKQKKYTGEVQDSHLEKISEVIMEAVADKEAKRKRNELTESNITSKRKRVITKNWMM
ncbi:F-box/kelch-repeat protein At3g06240-like [Papaver somniferum]|uniref:F-box/kelch-repeat protein At3g06240-like n=1 Tax=Papaver somniferum TaxID=3469 RepID=UPI000E703E80|nr:F-box/kelch-repeat protein At3g06240-like [Papaver somniferum]